MSRVFTEAVFPIILSPTVVTIAPSASINNLAAFTYAAWIFPTAYPVNPSAFYSAITSKDWDTAEIDMALASAGTGIQPGNHNLTAIGFGPDSTAKSAATSDSIALNQWQRCVMTFDFNGDKKFHLYINGVEVTYLEQIALTGGPFDDSGGPITVGQLNGATAGSGGFSGSIAQMELWSVALTPTQVAEDYAGTSVLSGNLVDSLTFLTDQGSVEPDVSGNGNDGVITAAAFSASNPPPTASRCYNTGPATALVGVPFDVTLLSTTSSDTPAAVTRDTVVTLSVLTGTGTLAGVITGTILKGQSTATISGVLYNVVENGVEFSSTSVSGDVLDAFSNGALTDFSSLTPNPGAESGLSKEIFATDGTTIQPRNEPWMGTLKTLGSMIR